MAQKRNFLLGKGERLTEPVLGTARVLDKAPPYTFDEARARLKPMLEASLAGFFSLPEKARPSNQVVGSIVLNPEYIAKSYHPEHILKDYSLRAVGSRAITLTPEARSNNRVPIEKPSTELFVAGNIASFRHFLADLDSTTLSDTIRKELPSFEQVSNLQTSTKIKGNLSGAGLLPIEVVLHANEFRENLFILNAFQEFLADFGLAADLDHRFHAGNLCFLRMRSPVSALSDIAQFSFLRLIREMPRLRDLSPLRGKSVDTRTVSMPVQTAINPTIRVAVFDGGIRPNTALAPWVTSYDPPGIGPAVEGALDHGYAVSSAVLFGDLSHDKEIARPYTKVDHIRVWDKDSSSDPLELYDVLERIKNTLNTTAKYDFINISLGPQLPIDDDDVHAWTSVLDEYLSDGRTLATVAVGNDGDAESTLGLDRIQVPADIVNGLGIGACTQKHAGWSRASYSSVGPGRSPGIVKPDLVAFGGSDNVKYHVLDAMDDLTLLPTTGTSFAAPHALRMAIGVMANFGSTLDPLATRALLVHTSEPGADPQHHIGWGKVRDEIDEITICEPGVARVVYQGELTASKYLRAEIPLPDEQLLGNVKITATCCFATEVDAAHTSTYTRSGLEIVFRPDATRLEIGAQHAASDSFFAQSKLYETEDLRRRDAHKWETCLHSYVTKRATSLHKPSFDIHYVARNEGGRETQSLKIKYALVITVEAPRHADLYDMIVRKYRNILEPMLPIQVPIQVTT